VAALSCVLSACAASQSMPEAQQPGLAGTMWRLVEFRSSDDAMGVVTPEDPSRYTMALERDGRVAMQLDCNRATGMWTAVATNPESGSFSFGALVTTRAFCPEPSMDQQIARQAEYVRSYITRDGRLYLESHG